MAGIGSPNPNRMYASVVDSATGGIYRSNNGGVTFTRLPLPPRTEGRPYNIRILQDGALVVSYSARPEADGQTLRPVSGVFYSEDGGQTWQDRTGTGMQWYTKDVVIDPHDPTQNTWYACVWGRFTVFQGPNNAGNGGWYRTKDRGLTWTRIWANESAESLTIHPTQPDIAYFTAENDGLYVTSNLNAAQPVLDRVVTYPWWRPKRLFFDPGQSCRVWITSMGGGVWMGDMGPGPVQWTNIQTNINGFTVAFAPQVANAQTYTWDFGDGSAISTDAFPEHMYAAPGVYTVTCIATNGCSEQSFQKEVSIQCPNYTIQLDFVGNTGICSGQPAFLQATSGYANYEWHHNGASLGVFPLDFWTAGSQGLYFVRVIDSLGCKAVSNPVIVQLYDAPEPDFAVEINQYVATFLNESQHADTYLWDFGDMTPVAVDQDPVHDYGAPGQYWVQLTASNAHCLDYTLTIPVTLECVAPVLQLTAAGNTQICAGAAVLLQAQGNGLQQYRWFLNDMAIPGADSSTLPASVSGIYRVEATDGFSCDGVSNTIFVEVFPLPEASIQVLVNPVCANETTWLTGFGGVDYQWITPGGAVLNTQSLNFDTVAVSATGWYHLMVTDGSGCSDTMGIWLQVNPLPQLVVQPAGPVVMAYGDTLMISANDGLGAYLWNTGATTPQIFVSECGYYAVTVSAVNGCHATHDDILVSVKPELTFSNGVLVSSPAAGYQWYQDGQLIVGADQQTYQPTVTGAYLVQTYCDFGGWLESDVFFVVIVGVGEPVASFFNLYPNPVTQEEVYCYLEFVSVATEQVAWQMMDLSGRILQQGEMAGTSARISLETVPPGLYVLQCKINGIPTRAMKLIRQ